jgi:drug/metabolite transporter (DMT)-like permease
MRRRGWVLFWALCLIWGIPYLLIRVAVRELDPAVLVFGRTAIGAALLVPVAASRGQLRPLISHWRPLLVYTVVELAVPWFLLSDAEKRLSSSLSGLLVAAVPLMGAAASLLSGGEERLSWRQTAGLFVGLAGVGALLGLDVKGADLGAAAEVVVVAVGYALGPQLAARKLADLPNLGVVAASLSLTALGYAPAALLELPREWPGSGPVASVATLGVVCTALAFLLFFGLIREIGPVRATVITYVNPAVAVALGVLVLGEPFGINTALGFVLVIAGSVLATRRPQAREAVTAGGLAPDPNAGIYARPARNQRAGDAGSFGGRPGLTRPALGQAAGEAAASTCDSA